MSEEKKNVNDAHGRREPDWLDKALVKQPSLMDHLRRRENRRRGRKIGPRKPAPWWNRT